MTHSFIIHDFLFVTTKISKVAKFSWDFFGTCPTSSPPQPTPPPPSAKFLSPFPTQLQTVVHSLLQRPRSLRSAVKIAIIDQHPTWQRFVEMLWISRSCGDKQVVHHTFFTFSTSFLTALKGTKRFKSTR